MNKIVAMVLQNCILKKKPTKGICTCMYQGISFVRKGKGYCSLGDLGICSSRKCKFSTSGVASGGFWWLLVASEALDAFVSEMLLHFEINLV